MSMFILDFLTPKIGGKRTSFFIDSLLWYVKGDLYQDHDAALLCEFFIAT